MGEEKSTIFWMFITVTLGYVIGGFENGCITRPRRFVLSPGGRTFALEALYGSPDAIAAMPADEIRWRWIITEPTLIKLYREAVTGLKLTS